MSFIRTLLLLLLFSVPAMAQQGVNPGPSLTTEKARAFVDSYEDLLELAREHEEDIETQSFEDLDPDDLNAAMAALSSSSAVGEFMEIIEDHGFADMLEWSQTSQRFISAYTAIRLEEGEDEMDSEIEEGIAQIRANEHFTDEQKDQMIEMLKQSQGMMNEMQSNVSESDKEAVRAVKDDFDRLMNVER